MVKLLSFYQGRDSRKPTGGYRARPYKVKRKALGGGPPTNTILSDNESRNVIRVFGGNVKVKAINVQYANLYIPKEGKVMRVKILRILETPANKELAKRDVIVKGSIIETEKGRAVVTSRPGQDGIINAILLEK
ncbi:30S ribosomal protein S8e [Vulcanisaeta souniana]|uniref:Small ribosomal subunit protein eS8 n=1 Tax=Vulcanisaeta souniana JCM 11219 TaxID=1293586 RepID=A0A830E8Y0_9CREN|nr:30S ribosomal protein S8e [Vulcanisaeta souniana]BDR93063.1 30S ribosomal protein S8e [Vulcanisaeta souniana JCM 11219]GGI83189.1 30S ribosomal protein S8e [Vulcanisaeta souniana JCM 11219]